MRKNSILLTVILIIFLSFASFAQFRFTDVTGAMGVPGWRIDGISAYTHAATMADITGDGLPEIYISAAVRGANGKVPETLYISHAGAPYSEEDGKRYVSDSYGLTGSHGICFVDFDNDGDYDIFNATTDDRIRLYRNDGNAFFEDYTESAQLPKNEIFLPTYGYVGYGTRGIVAFDANNDGYMDLLGVNWGPVEDKKANPWTTPPQPNEFYLNNGDSTYRKVDDSGLTPINPSNIGTQGVTAVDVDNDDDMDVFVCHRNYAYLGKDENGIDMFGPGPEPAPNELFINNGSGFFSEETRQREIYNPANDCNGATFADYDNDGDMDLFVISKQVYGNAKVYKNLGNGYFQDVSGQVVINMYGFSIAFLDIENDGDLDIFAPRSYHDIMLYINDGHGNYSVKSGSEFGLHARLWDPRATAVGDIDDDGDQDIYMSDTNKKLKDQYSNRLFRNDTPTGNRWLKVYGRGPKGDMGAFGTKIWVFDKGYMDDMNHLVGYRQIQNTYGYLCQDDPVQHFGLGQRDAVDVKIRMLDGTTLKLKNVAARKRVFFGKPSMIAKINGDGQSGDTGQVLPIPLRVKVLDAYGNAVPGAPVRFTSKVGGGTFVESQPVYTDAQGYAETQYILGGLMSGQIIEASCLYAEESTVLFTAYAHTTNKVYLSLVSGDNQTGSIDAVLPESLVVSVRDSGGNAFQYIPVTFKVVDGGGKVDEADSVSVLTDANGHASVKWRMGPTYATRQVVAAYITSDAAKAVTFNAMTSGWAEELIWLTTTEYSGVVNTVLSDTLIGKITDANNEPVDRYPVDFVIKAGGGKVNGQDSVTALTDEDGLIKAVWQLGKIAGVKNNILQVNGGNLDGSPVTVTASGIAAEPYRLVKVSGDQQTASALMVLPQPFVVAVVDTFANPVGDYSVIFEIKQGEGHFRGLTKVDTNTDELGQAKVYLTLGQSQGQITVHAYSDSSLVDEPAIFSATATPPSFSPQNSFVVANSPYIANGRDKCEVKVYIRDALNRPVAEVPVAIYAKGNQNEIEQPSYPTNAEGIAIGYLSSSKAEYKKVWAQVGAESVSIDSIKVLFKAGPAAEMTLISEYQKTAVVGRSIADTIHVALTDSFTNAVGGAVLASEMHTPRGEKVELASAITDSAGVATFLWRMSEQVGQHIFIVRYGNLPALTLQIEGEPGVPAALELLSGDNQSSFIGTLLPEPFQVCVKDSAGEPLTGIDVSFEVVSGEGSFPDGNVVATDLQGIVTIYFQLGDSPGALEIKASVPGLEQSLTFKAVANKAPANKIQIVAGSNQSGRGGKVLAQSPTVRVVDATGSPMPGVFVIFEVNSGGGLVAGPDTVITNEHGQASADWRLGMDGPQQLRAYVQEHADLNALFEANLQPNQSPSIYCFSDTTIHEMDVLLFAVEGNDPDGDSLAFAAQNLPVGAQFSPESHFLSWQPDYDQAGVYYLTFSVSDEYGDMTEKTAKIVVFNTNRPPLVENSSPSDSVIKSEHYKMITFEVHAKDLDGDTLFYHWRVNESSLGYRSSVNIMPTPAFTTPFDVTVTITDIVDTVTVKWQVEIVTRIEEKIATPDRYELHQNYPNPFNPTTRIDFSVPQPSHVNMVLFNDAGQIIRVLTDGSFTSGRHAVIWDARDKAGRTVPSGIYYCRMVSGSFSGVIKLILMK